MHDLSVLIQGPLDKTSLDNIDKYKQYGHIIISYWHTNNYYDIDKIPGVTLVCRTLPDMKQTIHCRQNSTFYYAITSTLNGLLTCNTKYVLKVRGDERYENLQPLLDKFEEYKFAKIVCGNIFAYNHNMYPFHLGDHIFIGQTKILQDALYNLYNFYSNKLSDPFFDQCCIEGMVPNHAEPILFKTISHQLGYNQEQILNVGTNKNIIRDNFDIIDINKLSPFVAKYNADRTTYINKFDWPTQSLTDVLK